jgi:hypothetical protein
VREETEGKAAGQRQPSFTIAAFCDKERHGWLNPALVLWLLNSSLQLRNFMFMAVLGKRPVEHARNWAMTEFLTHNTDWLVMIDNDITPQVNLLDLVNDVEQERIIAPVTYMWRAKDGSFALTAADKVEGKKHEARPLKEELVESRRAVDRVGTGCIFIHRKAAQKIPRPWFRMILDERSGKIVEGEDYFFCRRAKKHGFQVYVDARFVCGHLHTYDILDVHETWARVLAAKEAQCAK